MGEKSFEETRLFQDYISKKKHKDGALTVTIYKYLADLLDIEYNDLVTLRFEHGPPKRIIIEKMRGERHSRIIGLGPGYLIQ